MNKFVILLLAAGLTSCQSKQPGKAVSKTKQPITGQLQQLVGTWVNAGNASFGLFHIKADSTGDYVFYSNHLGELPKLPVGAPRYFFEEGPLQVRYRPHTASNIHYIPNLEVQIFTRTARFDYELVGDTLREFDKMGYQGKLVRMHNSLPASQDSSTAPTP